MNFVDVDGRGRPKEGYPKINLDHVAKLIPVRGDHGGLFAFDCHDIHGEDMGRISDIHVPDMPSTIIPDHTGTILIAGWQDKDGSVSLTRYPVLAWRVDPTGFSGEPVICESLPEHWCLQLSTGVFVFPEDGIVENLDDVKAFIAERFAKDEARRQKKRDGAA